eukprot:TRINITY_DN14533_c0_g1_i6.p2 TRINITY_DN14533_c0_g1~~TRINITY_DN14533_c0_g1_i6.p2  ORF type:complete len:248 (+),score=93.88 TRINITY_DN14533_c0_g1_i6:1105-1848(+)
MTESIGMMEGAFFVSRTEILSWVNTLLKLDLTKIEQTCTGAVACQIMDVISPGCIAMKKVNWEANKEYEYIANYKLLQQAFLKLGLKKEIEVEKLIKGKYQDNLEFMQWLKRYYDIRSNGTASYNPVTRRKSSAAPVQRRPKTVAKSAKENKAVLKTGGEKESAKKEASREEELGRQVEVLSASNKTLQKERDFYFSKLRDLEILMHFYEKEKIPLVENIEKILYATEDDKVVIDDRGELTIVEDKC